MYACMYVCVYQGMEYQLLSERVYTYVRKAFAKMDELLLYITWYMARDTAAKMVQKKRGGEISETFIRRSLFPLSIGLIVTVIYSTSIHTYYSIPGTILP